MPEPAVKTALLDHEFMIDFLLVVFTLFIVLIVRFTPLVIIVLFAMLVILSTVLVFHLLTCIDMPVLLVGMLIVLMVVLTRELSELCGVLPSSPANSVPLRRFPRTDSSGMPISADHQDRAPRSSCVTRQP